MSEKFYDNYQLELTDLGPDNATFMGYLNLTEENEIKWRKDSILRLCMQIYRENDPKNVEMVRFIN